MTLDIQNGSNHDANQRHGKEGLMAPMSNSRRLLRITGWQLLQLFALVAFQVSSQATAADHINVTREVIIENSAGITPETIVRTHDGGYVVAGYTIRAWAARLDGAGNVLWRFARSNAPNSKSYFHGAAMLPDDSMILCGEVKTDNSDGLHIFGLLTHIDKLGHVVSERLVSPNDGKAHGSTYLRRCMPFEGGVVALGTTSSPVWETPNPGWLVGLDAKGNAKWEKQVPELGGLAQPVVTMTDHSFASHTTSMPSEPGAISANRISTIDVNGALKATRIISNWSFPVQSISDDRSIHLLTSDGRGVSSFETLNDTLTTISQTRLALDLLTPTRAYVLPDRSLMLFGYQESGSNSYTASMEWINPELAEKESYVFEPHFGAFKVADAVPTGQPGEFAVVRLAIKNDNIIGSHEKRDGIVLNFVHVQ
jgi:hypothetical protein